MDSRRRWTMDYRSRFPELGCNLTGWQNIGRVCVCVLCCVPIPVLPLLLQLELIKYGSRYFPFSSFHCNLVCSRCTTYLSAHIEDMYAKSITKAFQKHFVTDPQALGYVCLSAIVLKWIWLPLRIENGYEMYWKSRKKMTSHVCHWRQCLSLLSPLIVFFFPWLSTFTAPWEKLNAETVELATLHGQYSLRISNEIERPMRDFAKNHPEWQNIALVRPSSPCSCPEFDSLRSVFRRKIYARTISDLG